MLTLAYDFRMGELGQKKNLPAVFLQVAGDRGNQTSGLWGNYVIEQNV